MMQEKVGVHEKRLVTASEPVELSVDPVPRVVHRIEVGSMAEELVLEGYSATDVLKVLGEVRARVTVEGAS